MLTILRKNYYSTLRRNYSTNFKNDYPLSDIRILDLTRIVAGPYCTMILGDLGADVIKIEKPFNGDESRNWGPPYANGTSESCYFIALNRNKRSLCVDLKSKEGRQIIYELCKKSDVLIENYVPGKLDEMDLGYEKIKKISPSLIYCSITGYGPKGPYSSRPGYDVIAASIGGFLHITGPENGGPIKAGVAVTDLATGLYAHGAIMAALIRRTKTGLGQKIDCNLLSTQIASLINIGSNYLNAGKEAKRWGTAHESIVPYQTFSTSDGYLTIGTGSEAQFKDLCRRLDKMELIEDERFTSNADRVKNRNELIAILQNVLKNKSKREWMEIFCNASFPCGPVNTLSEVFDDEHVKAIGLIEEIEHPEAGTIKLVGQPVNYEGNVTKIQLPPPTLGQHTDDVLRNLLNYDSTEIERLFKEGIVQ